MKRWFLQPLLLIATCGLHTQRCSSFSLTAPLSARRSFLVVAPAKSRSNNGDEDDKGKPRRSRSSSARAQSARVSDGLKGRQTARRLSSKAKQQRIIDSRRPKQQQQQQTIVSPAAQQPSPQEKKERCGFCGERFDSRFALFRHIRESASCNEAALLTPRPTGKGSSSAAAAASSSARRRMPKGGEKESQQASNEGGKGEAPRAQRCGYCGRRFETRSKLFRHLREDNSCRKLAISHGMPLENPYKTKDRRLRRVYGDVLLAGCIVLYRKPGNPVESPVEMAFKRPLYADDDLFKQYEVVLVRNAGGRKGFPKGKIELSDSSLLGAALRETWEEAGLRANQLKVLPAWAAVEVRKRECAGDEDEEEEEDADDIEEEEEEEEEEEDDDEEEMMEDDAEDGGSEEDLVSLMEQQRLSPKSAFIDVREITGRLGKRARYFVCAVLDDTNLQSSPKSTKSVALTNKNDVDRDIEEVKWMRAHDAMKELGSKRRTALRRALAIHEVYFESQQQQQLAEGDEKKASSRRVEGSSSSSSP